MGTVLGTLSQMFGIDKKPKQLSYGTMLNGITPIYSSASQNIYANDVVQQALDCIVNELKKLNPKHIRYDGFDPLPVRGNMQNILNNPNPLMTTSEFIEKWAWMLLLTYNSFIYIQRNRENKVIGLYPLNPSVVTFLEDQNGRLYLDMTFGSGYKSTVPYDNIIHLKTHFAQNDLMGGNELGKPDHDHIKKTIQINNDLLEGIRKAMNVSCTINGIVKYNTMMDDGTMEANIKSFEEKLQNSKSGLMPMDIKNEFTPLPHDIKLIDKDTLEFLDSKILRNWHVPVEIIMGKYSAEIYESFYQTALEPIIVAASQAFTKKIFTEQQQNGYDNKIIFYPRELIFMNSTQKLAMIKELGQTGSLYENEKRVAFGYVPLPELNGVRMQSLNWVEAKYAREYQLQNKKTITGLKDE